MSSRRPKRVDLDLVVRSFSTPAVVGRYAADTDRIGLWNSEKIFYSRHLPRPCRLLDLGCGAGRTTFGLLKEGYSDITGADISPAMIRAGLKKAGRLRKKPRFLVADARQLPFRDGSFDVCLFSFNGLMQIPGRKDRLRAMKEICRVLRKGGRFVFTTHDRDRATEYSDYWKKERTLWKKGNQDPRLLEFGDLIVRDVDCRGDVSFIHIPGRQEIVSCLKSAGFRLVEDYWRPEIGPESRAVQHRSADCRFWAAEKC